MDDIKIALCQMMVTDDKDKNLQKAVSMINEASENGADIVVLPEIFNCPYDNSYFDEYSEDDKGKTITLMRETAKNNKILLVAGSITEKENDNLYNSSYIIDESGIILGKHRKSHLFDVDIEDGITFFESKTLSSGNNSTVLDTKYGKIGVAICYDIRFPEFIRKMVLDGAEIVIIPAAFNMTTGPAHWHITSRVRALDNQVYLAVNSPARNMKASYNAYGHSLIVDPWGKIISEAGIDEEIIYGEVSKNYLRKVRKELPLLKHRKPDIY